LPGQDWLYEANQWLILAISLGMLLAVTEIGFRRGRRRDGSANATVTQITTLQAAAFGILALLIGFTFAMALSRFEERRDVVLAEANAIGTVGLRAQLLPQPQADDAIPLLRRYVDLRLRLVEANLDPDELRLVVSQSLELQQALWADAVTAIVADPRPAVSGLFTQALNEMIDLHAKRLAALTNHVPDTVFVLLYMVAAIALGFAGYGCGLGRTRNLVVTTVMAFLVVLTITLIQDIDRLRRGLIHVSQQPIVDAQAGLAKPR